MSPQQAAAIILDNISLESEQYRLGKTKVLITAAFASKSLSNQANHFQNCSANASF